MRTSSAQVRFRVVCGLEINPSTDFGSNTFFFKGVRESVLVRMLLLLGHVDPRMSADLLHTVV